MSPAARAAADQHAISEFPREACGVVIIEGGEEVYVPCRNDARTKSEHFICNYEDAADAEDRGEVIMLVHSHPNVPARPSQADLVECEKGNIAWMIIAVWKEAGDAVPRIVADHVFAPSGYEAPLVGREYSFGTLDCYTIIRDWYARTQGIVLPDFERRDEFWTDKHGPQVDLYGQYEAAGFELVKDGTLRIGDIVLSQVARSTIRNHAAVYIGDGMILHHTYNRLSSRDPYDYASGQRKAHLIVRRK